MSAEPIQDELVELYPCGHERSKANTMTVMNTQHGTPRMRCRTCKNERMKGRRRANRPKDEADKQARRAAKVAARWEDIDFLQDNFTTSWPRIADRLGISYESLKRWMASNPREK